MKHLIFEEAESYPIALLIKTSAFSKRDIEQNYVTPLLAKGVLSNTVIAFNLKSDNNGKHSVSFIKDYLIELLSTLQSVGTMLLYVAEGAYFKVLTKQSRAEPHLGYVLPCSIKGYEHMSVVLGINHQALIYNPELKDKLELSLATVANTVQGTHTDIGTRIIHGAWYPQDARSIKEALKTLHGYPSLTCDIETFSLRFNEAGIGTIAFAWDEHNGIAFACDYMTYEERPDEGYFGWKGHNKTVRALLLDFFSTYRGKLTWHNATFDIKMLVYSLWMSDLLDTEGLLTGLDVMTCSFDDSKIIAYLATNTTAGNVLGLKALAHEFAGNYAKEDIKDIRKIPIGELLEYNLVDCLSTWFVKNKYTIKMIEDNQEDIYRTLMLPSLKVIIQMELTGMPMKESTIIAVKAKLEQQQSVHEAIIMNHPVVEALSLSLRHQAMVTANAKLKTKQHPLSHFDGVLFNPNSGLQLQGLLYDFMGLPIIDYTDTKQAATGGKTLKKLINHCTEPAHKELLSALIAHGNVSKILSTFIPAFEKGIDKDDGAKYLHGSFNLGGTVSGRLSSSDPNLQNIPAKSVFGKMIKECFTAPHGWLFVGADFHSLEDYVSALTTRDPNKLLVYTQGYDGHCLRAKAYFSDQMPDISDTVESINSIETLYPELRQNSKGGTFALTYLGTWHTLVNNLGFSEEQAKAIERGYHELYAVSDAYVQDRLKQASLEGYVEVAFGLRVRTPLLAQVIYGSRSVPYEAAAEGRTAGNALGQSYGLLNNRAAVAFMTKVWASKHRLDIKPVALIHDAIYLVVKDDAEVVAWVNQELILAMQWQELPELQHDVVKLGADLEIYWPDWAHSTKLKNGASAAAILAVCAVAKQEILSKLKPEVKMDHQTQEQVA